MANTISPAVYQRMGLQQVRLKSMPRGKFIQWITDFYNDAYKTGWNECMDKCNGVVGAWCNNCGYCTKFKDDYIECIAPDIDGVPVVGKVKIANE